MQGAATPVRRCAFFRADFDIKSAADVLARAFRRFSPYMRPWDVEKRVHKLAACQVGCLRARWVVEGGTLTFFQPKTSYAASPSDILYWAGFIPPNDTLMRFLLYQSMYSPSASMNRPVDQPFQSRP